MRGEDSDGTQAVVPTVFDLNILIVMTGVFCHCFRCSVLIIPKSITFERLRCTYVSLRPIPAQSFPKTNGPNKSSLLLILSLRH
jgi:hypothetical protein